VDHEVWVAAGSSYAEHLRALRADLEQRNLATIGIRETPTLSTEDLFEMVSAGVIDFMVSDAYKAELWAEVLDGLRPRPDLVVHAGGSLAWAVRKNNPELLLGLNEFVLDARQGTLLGNVLAKRYFGSTRWIENPIESDHRTRFEEQSAALREIATEYEFDWLRIAAQCFQESRLDPEARSASGALGLMQLLPSTASDMGCEDPFDPEQNLHAGMRYLVWLRENFFDDPELQEPDRTELILAAYNAGPGTVRRWRRQAAANGSDPNRWRKNVERIAFQDGNLQPIRYIENIEKYYIAYSLALELDKDRERAKRLWTEPDR
jgi:membrane-bound lytic murein transglycosylase MltF